MVNNIKKSSETYPELIKFNEMHCFFIGKIILNKDIYNL